MYGTEHHGGCQVSSEKGIELKLRYHTLLGVEENFTSIIEKKLKDTDSYSVVNPDQNWICRYRYLVRNFVFIYGSI